VKIFAAYENGGIVGFTISREIDSNKVELAGIIVSESRTRIGIGISLLEAV
jgi:hypothetical protein